MLVGFVELLRLKGNRVCGFGELFGAAYRALKGLGYSGIGPEGFCNRCQRPREAS